MSAPYLYVFAERRRSTEQGGARPKLQNGWRKREVENTSMCVKKDHEMVGFKSSITFCFNFCLSIVNYLNLSTKIFF